MKQRTIPIDEAEVAELREFARTMLQIEIEGREPKHVLRSKIKAAGYHADKITLFDASSVEAAEDRRDARGRRVFKKTDEATGREREYVRILIPQEDKPGGDEPVPAGVNGRIMYIPRGEPQDVPVEYVEALENAVEFVYEPYNGEGLGGLKPPREVKSYPFQYA